MAAKTKMIIITSDEDFIRQVSTKQNTRLIDLDDREGINNPISQSTQDSLNDLPDINSRIDHVHKRGPNSPSDQPLKSVKTSRKPVNSVCAVCGDRAIGFNYDVLSCNACKIFFHRNANQNLEQLRCLTGEHQCPVGHEIRRKCTRCRLDRCFTVGMRKDFLMSEEELRVRKERLKPVRNISSTSNIPSDSEILSEIDQLLGNTNENDDYRVVDQNTTLKEMEDLLFETLSVEDWLTIENIRTAFLSAFEKHSTNYSSIDLSDLLSALITWSHCFNDIALCFIEFYRHIEEFEHLHDDDRFTLIKYNLLCIYPISKCFKFQSNGQYSLYHQNDVNGHHAGMTTLFDLSTDMSQSMMNMLISHLRLSEQDSTFLILLMIILIFTQGLSMNETEPPLNDPLAVSRAQMRYTTLLWNYLINKRGEVKATQQLIQLMNTILLIQSKTKTFQELLCARMASSDAVDQIAPLLQTVLHIS